MIKKLLVYILLFFAFLLFVSVMFYLWARQGRLTEDELTVLKKYEDNLSEKERSGSYTVVSYNIGYLSGMTNNLTVTREKEIFDKNLKTVIDVLSELKPDLIAYQEIDYYSARSHYINQSESIAKTCGFAWQADVVNWDKNYVPYPYSFDPAFHFGQMLSGQSIHSMHPIESQERIVLEKVINAPFYYHDFYLDRLAQVSKIIIEGKPLILINVHLEAFDAPTRIAQTKTLIHLYQEYAKKYPVLMIGDFNSLAPTQEYRDSKEYEETIDLLLNSPNLRSACKVEHFSRKGYFTYPADNPNEQIDYIFYTPETIEVLSYRPIAEMGTASDHLPVMARWKFKTSK